MRIHRWRIQHKSNKWCYVRKIPLSPNAYKQQPKIVRSCGLSKRLASKWYWSSFSKWICRHTLTEWPDIYLRVRAIEATNNTHIPSASLPIEYGRQKVCLCVVVSRPFLVVCLSHAFIFFIVRSFVLNSRAMMNKYWIHYAKIYISCSWTHRRRFTLPCTCDLCASTMRHRNVKLASDRLAGWMVLLYSIAYFYIELACDIDDDDRTHILTCVTGTQPAGGKSPPP